MTRIELLDADGDFLVAVLVPGMLVPPDVICWGLRYFTRRVDEAGAARYLEGFVYFVPPGGSVK